MKLLLSVYPWSLYQVACHVKPFCWYFHGGPGYKAGFRDDDLIYRSGFKTKDAALAWAKKEKILSEDFEDGEKPIEF